MHSDDDTLADGMRCKLRCERTAGGKQMGAKWRDEAGSARTQMHSNRTLLESDDKLVRDKHTEAAD